MSDMNVNRNRETAVAHIRAQYASAERTHLATGYGAGWLFPGAGIT